LAQLTSKSLSNASDTHFTSADASPDAPEPSASAVVPLRRDILIRKKDKQPVHMKMMNKENGYERTKSRVGEEYQVRVH
jgi:hypothetical protein